MGNKDQTKRFDQVSTETFDPIINRSVSPFSDTKPEPMVPWVLDFHIGKRLLQLQVHERMIIGRGESGTGAPDVDLDPLDAHEHGVSRRHAILLTRERFLTIRDLNSTNGTFINGLRLQRSQDVPLEHGDRLQFGKLEMQLMFAVLPPHKHAFADSDYRTLKPVIPGDGKHVFVVEDDREVALTYQMMLRAYGYRVSVAQNLAEARTVLSKYIPDAVVTDLQLKSGGDNLDGLKVLRALKRYSEENGSPPIPCLVVSGQIDQRVREQAVEAGATLFLPKPVRVDEIAVRVGMLIQQVRAIARSR